MNTNAHSRPLFFLLSLAMLPLVGGCSLLGFSAYPVAHIMTDDTKTVLGQTPNGLNVARELAKEVQPIHFLQPGDELLIEMVDDSADFRLPADQQVMADGSIDLERFGRLVVASMTLEQAEASIQRIIFDDSSDSVAVNVRLIQPIHRYYVIGEVNSPGAYSMTGHETVLDAIMEAGGLTARASACDLLLARPTSPCSCRVTLPVCYRAITQLGDTSTNYHLKPGDRIFVSRQSVKEEFTAYFHGGKTCARCCNNQTACCDPRSATATAPDFLPADAESIAPVPPPRPETEPDATDQERKSDQLLPEPSSTSQPPSGSQPPGPMPTSMDGELDFRLLLNESADSEAS